jgi:hypothetical protein
MNGGPEVRVDDLLARLPKGETVLWQGRPDRAALARRVFRIRAVAVYFCLLAVWRFAASLHDGASLADAAGHGLWILPLAAVCIGILSAMASGYAKTTRYVLSDKRLVMRTGIAMPITVNLPLAHVVGASVARHSDGTADIPIEIDPGQRIAWLVLWPSSRPWRFTRPVPMLRGIRDADPLVGALAGALEGQHGRGSASVARAEPTTDLSGSAGGHVPASAAA